MGYIRHNAIIVTSGLDEFDKAYNIAKEIFGDLVSNVVESGINYYKSFFIAPDGSKEGWDKSEWGDKKRDEFVKRLEKMRFGDKSSPIDWVEIQYGDDDNETKIMRDNDYIFR